MLRKLTTFQHNLLLFVSFSANLVSNRDLAYTYMLSVVLLVKKRLLTSLFLNGVSTVFLLYYSILFVY